MLTGPVQPYSSATSHFRTECAVRHGSNDLHTQCGPKNGPQIRRTSPQMNIHENYTTRIARLQKTDLNWLYNHHINFINCRKVSTQVGSSMMFPNHFQGVQLFYPKLGVANGLLWLLWLHIVAIGWCEPVEAHEPLSSKWPPLPRGHSRHPKERSPRPHMVEPRSPRSGWKTSTRTGWLKLMQFWASWESSSSS